MPQVGRAPVFGAADRFSPYCQYSATPSGTFFCVSQVDPRADRGFAITLGVPYEHSRSFRGQRRRSGCGRPARTASAASGRRRTGGPLGRHGVAVGPGALPRPVRAAGIFPGVDEADVYEFLDRHNGYAKTTLPGG